VVKATMGDTQLPAILAADGVGYGKLAGADEERTLRGRLRSDLIDPPLPCIMAASSTGIQRTIVGKD
jgi:hypothetical protein